MYESIAYEVKCSFVTHLFLYECVTNEPQRTSAGRLTFGCLFIDLFYIGIPVMRTNGWTHGHVITKISRMGRLPHFLRHGATLERVSRARGAPLLMSLLNLFCHYPFFQNMGRVFGSIRK